MKRSIKKVTAIFSLVFLFSLSGLSGEEIKKIDFYGVISPDADRNMNSMTEELFYTQLNELSISVEDKRNTDFSSFQNPSEYDFSQTSDSDASAMFVYIKKLPSMKWNCSLELKKISTGKTCHAEKEYDSYYKILMESKSNLNELISELLDSSRNQKNTDNNDDAFSTPVVSTEAIAGSWNGEPFIDKIVILRGGRGFVIYKNGASMNISVSINQQEGAVPVINVKQASSNNASFYPELSRKDALQYAVSANPIQWNLSYTKNNTLKGTKTTLLQPVPGNEPAEGTVEVEWSKIN